MPVVQISAAKANRQQRRARMSRSHQTALSRPTPAECAPTGDSANAFRLLLEEAVLLDLFGRPPVVFHRCFVDIAGGVGPALWLSHAVALMQAQGTTASAFQTVGR